MIELRVYRAAFVPALLAAVLVAFSLEGRPPAPPQGLAADVLFEGRLAVATLRRIVREHPDRRPGTPGNAAVARLVERELVSREGFETRVDRFTAEGEELVNVVTRRAGASRRQIVVVAGRDARGVPDATASAADTAALLEVARVVEGRPSRQTLVLASVDGSTLGDAGARRLAETIEDRGHVEAVLVLSNLASARARGPLLLGWANDASRGGVALQRTAAASLRQELARLPPDEGAPGQLARLAFPLGIGAQGVLLEAGLDAIRFSGSGELPPPARERGPDDVHVGRFGDLGRAVLRTITALDGGGRLEHGPRPYVTVARKVLPGWTLAVLSLCLLLPPLAASVDAFARARRRREPVARWYRWLGAGVLPFVLGLGVAELLVLAGQAPDAPPAPLEPGAEPLDAAAAASLGAVAACVALAWLVARPGLARLTGPLPDPAAPGAGCAVALAGSLTALAVWAINPYGALLLVPAVHLWAVASLVEEPLRPRSSAVLAAASLALPAGAALLYLERLSLNPLEGAWYLFLLVTGHHVGLPTALLGCVLLGTFGSVLAILAARTRLPPVEPGDERPPLRGPAGYAGPGSLGGTESALRR